MLIIGPGGKDMPLVKTSVTVPDEIYKIAKKESRNFSSVVTEALKEYLTKRKMKKAIASFGKWEKRSQKSVDIVREMRREGDRDYANRSDRH